jgi:hypothetical protein
MPLKQGTSKKTTEENFDDVRHGKTFAKTKRKFGAKRAQKQMVAIVLSNKRKSAKKAKHKRG